MVVVYFGANTAAGAYIWLFLAGIGIMILGAERLASGLLTKGVSKSIPCNQYWCRCRSYYLYWIRFLFPQFATKWLILFIGFGLLANGIIRIFTGIRKKEEESINFSSIATGVVITSLSLLVLVYPKFGLALLLVMTAIALAVSGIQIILAGLRGRHSVIHSQLRNSKYPPSQEHEADESPVGV